MTKEYCILRFIAIATSMFIATIDVYAQTADELNIQSKVFLGKRDYQHAFPLIRQAAEKGNPEAQYNYGECFMEGVEVGKSDSLANTWFLKSAQQGWKDAQYKISYSYETGRGIQKDAGQAFYWTLKCAEQNDAECMFNLIGCYMTGTGTLKNTDSMLIWAIRLGKMENPENLLLSGKITSARANLATIYRDGISVPKNPVQSYMWFLIYNENKRDFSIPDQQHFIAEIQELEKSLTGGEKMQAQMNAEKLLNRKLKNMGRLNKVDE